MNGRTMSSSSDGFDPMANRGFMAKLNVDEYLRMGETQRPMELIYGFVREPPAPRYGHQSVLTHLVALLDEHVRDRRLGQVCAAPVDVVLDEAAALVVQPDIVLVAATHQARVRDRVWGAPDLVVEILSPRTATRDRTTKLAWYRRYGVIECWLVDVTHRSVEVVELQAPGAGRTPYSGNAPMHSTVLPNWTVAAAQIFS